MKLLTHNMLSCHIKGVTNNFPFKIEATKIEEVDTDFDPEFLRRMFDKIEWSALREGAEALGVIGLPEKVSLNLGILVTVSISWCCSALVVFPLLFLL